jgi:undecaprenyl pyrophosphate phosphatase UppP
MSISFLVSLTQKNRLWYFSIYTLFLSILLGLYNGI